MQYRDFGSLKFKVSALGFGCMRLPTTDEQRNSPHIDEAESIRMIQHAIDLGVNYLDTAYTYHGGQSERLLGRALGGGYRKQVRVATKLPVWFVRAPEDFDRILAEQQERLQTEKIDFYLFHALNRRFWREGVLAHRLLERAERALGDGRIGHLGFSFHGEYELFEEILDATSLWSFCQLQYNYMHVEDQAGQRGLKLAADRGLGVVVMEPLLGGRLADPPSEVRELMEAFPLKRTPVEWALKWLWNQPEVSVVLSGMTTMAQLEENLRLAAEARTHCFGTKEEMLLGEVRACYGARTAIACTQCGYCQPCPNGLDIPANIALYNYAQAFSDAESARLRYRFALTESERASNCQQCGGCTGVCPQQIPIGEWMQKIAAELH